jgi:uncharacterized protein with von Willebrand factor type A (vWA) domain
MTEKGSFLNTFFSDKSNWKRANKLSKSVINHDKWDEEDFTKLLEEMREFSASEDRLTDFVETGGSAFGDTFYAFVKADPTLASPQGIRPSHLINRAVEQQMMDLKEYEELRSFTAGDQIGSALACITIEPDLEILFDKLKQEMKAAQQLEQQLEQYMDLQEEQENLEEMMQQALQENGKQPQNYQEQAARIQEQLEKLGQSIQDGAELIDQSLNKKGQSIKAAMKKLLDKANQEAADTETSATAWGLDPGTLRRLPVEERLELARKLNTPKFRKIAELFGPMQRLAFAEQMRKTIHASDEIYNLELGNDLSRVIPVEFLALGHEALTVDFLRKYLEGELLSYSLRGSEKIAKGGIIFVEDGSGSMSGQREIWAKAVGLCLLNIAKLQKRAFYAIHFGGPGQIRVFDFRDTEKITVDQVIEFAGTFFGGGPLRIDQRVATPTGWKQIGSIAVGDEVFGPDGKPTTVTGVYPQGTLTDMYKVRFKDGAEVICDATHLWTVSDRSARRKLITVPLSSIIEKGIRHKHSGYNFSVPIAEPLSLPAQDLPIHPYLLGYLLGDGSISRSPAVIATAEGDDLPWIDHLPDGIQAVKYINSLKVTAQPYGLSSLGPAGTPNPLNGALRELGLQGLTGGFKFIPTKYLWASNEQRWDLLQGLCDTDGSPDGPGYVLYSTESERLALDVIQLAQSLGCVASVSKTEYPNNPTWNPNYRLIVSIRGDRCPFRLKRHIKSWQPRKREYSRSIVEAERTPDASCVCIKVAREDGLFLTEGMVVTHNTDFMTPLSKALDILEEEYTTKGEVKADIIFASDGECGIAETFLKKFKEEQEKMAFRVYGIAIDVHPDTEPLKTICDGRVLTIKDLLSGNDIREIFRGI